MALVLKQPNGGGTAKEDADHRTLFQAFSPKSWHEDLQQILGRLSGREVDRYNYLTIFVSI